MDDTLSLGLAWAGPGLGLGWAWTGPGLDLGWAWTGPGLGLGLGWAWARLGLGWGLGLEIAGNSRKWPADGRQAKFSKLIRSQNMLFLFIVLL